jgi:UMF1 family MFS transporter
VGGLRRLRCHPHAARFLVAQMLYLSGASGDGSIASLFGTEVVGLDLQRITLVTIAAAAAGALGAVVTLLLCRVYAERSLLLALMCCPPAILLYTACFLSTEAEFWVVCLLRAFVAGGVGFQGLNRGAFAKMIPAGREAEFFGLWVVAIKSVAWVPPVAVSLLNEATGSLRVASLAHLAFYLPALLVLLGCDFEAAQEEAAAAAPLVQRGGGSERERLKAAADPAG